MTPKILAVDCDLVLVDTLTPWVKAIEEANEVKFDFSANHEYDLCPLMLKQIQAANPSSKIKASDVFGYWEEDDIYDNLSVLPGVVDTLKFAKEKGWDVVIVSKCVPSHEDSKRNMVKRELGDLVDGFISTGDKHFVKYDLLVDDNAENVLKCRRYNPYSAGILFRGISGRVYAKDSTYFKIPYRTDTWQGVKLEIDALTHKGYAHTHDLQSRIVLGRRIDPFDQEIPRTDFAFA